MFYKILQTKYNFRPITYLGAILQPFGLSLKETYILMLQNLKEYNQIHKNNNQAPMSKTKRI